MQYYSAFLSAFAYAFHTLPQPIHLLLRQRLLLLYSFPFSPLLSLPRPEGSRKRGIRSLLDFASATQGFLLRSGRPEGSKKRRIRSLLDLAEGPAMPRWLALLFPSPVLKTSLFVHGDSLPYTECGVLCTAGLWKAVRCAKAGFLSTASESRTQNRGFCARKTRWMAGPSARCHWIWRFSVTPGEEGLRRGRCGGR
jgi:hypothetical protein